MAPLPTLRRSALALLLATHWFAVTPASAAHRARLGTDLEQTLARGAQAIDVIVDGTAEDVAALARRYNLTIKKALQRGAVFTVTAGQLEALARDEAVQHLAADAPVRSSYLTAEAIGADQLWAGLGTLPPLSGKGVGVALIDSGVDPRHASLAKRVVYTKDFLGGNGSDPFGHGTHVGALIAGAGVDTAEAGRLQGVAPSARLINLRVLDATGAGRASDVIAAIDWAIENRQRFNIRVINLSLGAPVTQSYHDDPMCAAVERAVDAGIVVVAAAGNYGASADGRPVYGSVTSPGNDPRALTVGAMDMHGTAQRSDDTLAPYSSKGPTRFDLVVKPDVVAPGTRLVSAEAVGSYLSDRFAERHFAGAGASAYMQLSGTSMAAGVASGAVALLLDAKPQLTPGQAKALLQLTSSPVTGEGLVGVGAGYVNSLVAVGLLTGNAGGMRSGPFILSGITTESREVLSLFSIVWGNAADSIVWGNALGMPVVWGTTASTTSIVWGNLATSIVWGNTSAIVWGNTADSIVWGNAADSIVWGNAADSIVWGNAADSIVWGNAADSIVWGNAADSIVWGN